MIFDFKLHTPNSSDTPLPRFFFVRACMRGFCSRARSDPQQMRSFWERSGPTEGGGSTPQVCGHVHMVCMCTPPEGWFHEPRSEAESALRKKKSCTLRVHSHAHAHAHTCACRRACTHAHTNVRAGECAHMHVHVCTRRVHEIHAPEA